MPHYLEVSMNFAPRCLQFPQNRASKTVTYYFDILHFFMDVVVEEEDQVQQVIIASGPLTLLLLKCLGIISPATWTYPYWYMIISHACAGI
jgi:hypothetical protein